jgi:hypothetical protein
MDSIHNRADWSLDNNWNRYLSRSNIIERVLILCRHKISHHILKHYHSRLDSPFRIPSFTRTSIGGLDANCCSNELLLMWRSRLL